MQQLKKGFREKAKRRDRAAQVSAQKNKERPRDAEISNNDHLLPDEEAVFQMSKYQCN
jgi:hypothetical protein